MSEANLGADFALVSRGQDVSKAQTVLEAHCSKRRQVIIESVMKRIRDTDKGPLEPAYAIQKWLELAAIEDLHRDLAGQVRDGDRASERVEKLQK